MTEELKEQIHERVYNIKVPTLGFSRRDLFNIAMEYAEPREKRMAELERKLKVETELSNRLGLAYREYEQLTKEQDEHLAKLEKENAELKKNYEDSLVACGVLKAKVDTLAQPSPLESMQDTLITTQKAQNEKQKKQLTEAREIISIMRHLLFDVWGYIAIPLEKRVNNFLKQSNFK